MNESNDLKRKAKIYWYEVYLYQNTPEQVGFLVVINFQNMKIDEALYLFLLKLIVKCYPGWNFKNNICKKSTY